MRRNPVRRFPIRHPGAQVHQTSSGADVLTVGDPDTDALASALAAALRRHGLSDAGITVRVVDRLQRHESTGKLKRFVPLA